MWNPLDGLSTVNVGFKKLSEDATEPTYANMHAAGADLYADVLETTQAEGAGITMYLTIGPGERRLIKTGIAVELPPGIYGKIEGRSGLAFKHGIVILGGVIDSDYRGDIGVIMLNTGKEPFEVRQGDRIAQLIVKPYMRGAFALTESLDETNRGVGGFGSTGLK